MKFAQSDFITKIKNQRGGSLVEFAILAPLLFVILFGIIDFSVLLFDKAVITNASREGARAGIVFSDPRISDGEIITVVNNYCASHLISFGPGSTVSVVITRSGTGVSAGDSLTVTVNYPFRFLAISDLIGMFGGSFANPLNLRAVTVMRLE